MYSSRPKSVDAADSGVRSGSTYSQVSKVIPQRQKSHRLQCIVLFTKQKSIIIIIIIVIIIIIMIKIIVYIFIRLTSFESWAIYVIYIVILTGFCLCKLERPRIKFCVRHFGRFLSDFNIDVNGNQPFLKFPLNFEKTDIRYL